MGRKGEEDEEEEEDSWLIGVRENISKGNSLNLVSRIAFHVTHAVCLSECAILALMARATNEFISLFICAVNTAWTCDPNV